MRNCLTTALTCSLCCCAFASVAHAGCPNVCDITVQPATVDPPLDCLQVNASGQTCDCGVFITITNQCGTTLAFPDSTLYYCGEAGQFTTVDAGGDCSGNKRINSVGPGVWTLEVQESNSTHTLSIAYDVTSMDAGSCACAAAGQPRKPRQAWVGLALSLGLGIGLARRTKLTRVFATSGA